jgi:hypothetical protein
MNDFFAVLWNDKKRRQLVGRHIKANWDPGWCEILEVMPDGERELVEMVEIWGEIIGEFRGGRVNQPGLVVTNSCGAYLIGNQEFQTVGEMELDFFDLDHDPIVSPDPESGVRGHDCEARLFDLRAGSRSEGEVTQRGATDRAPRS